MNAVLEALSRIEKLGGRLSLQGERVRYLVPKGSPGAQSLLAELRAHRDEVVDLLRSRCLSGGQKVGSAVLPAPQTTSAVNILQAAYAGVSQPLSRIRCVHCGRRGECSCLPVRTCRTCGGRRFWRSIHGPIVCGQCHPPGSPALVEAWLVVGLRLQ